MTQEICTLTKGNFLVQKMLFAKEKLPSPMTFLDPYIFYILYIRGTIIWGYKWWYKGRYC